jgi:hypothetical protein
MGGVRYAVERILRQNLKKVKGEGNEISKD